MSQTPSSFRTIEQRQVRALRSSRSPRNMHKASMYKASGLDWSSVAGQETVTLVNEDVGLAERSARTGSNVLLDKASFDESGIKARVANISDSSALSLKARLQTSSKTARELIKCKHLADFDAPIQTCSQVKNGLTCPDHALLPEEPALHGLRGQVDSMACQLAHVNALKDDQDAQIAELEDLLNLAFTGIQQLQARNQELDHTCTDHERLLKGYEERIRDSQAMLVTTVSQVEQLTSENEKLVDQKAALYNALSESLATTGRKQTELETQIHDLKAALTARDAEVVSVRKELQDVRKAADDKVKATNVAWEKKMGEAVNQRARLRVEGIEHKHKVVYLEKQKAATEEALATCKIDLHAMTSKLRTAQDNLKRANAQTEAAQSREQACERHIAFLESMVPVEGKEAKRLTDLSNKLEKTMAKSKNARASGLHNLTNRRGAVEPLKDVFDNSPAPTRPIGKGPLAAAGHVSSITTNHALSLQDKRFGTAVRPASPYLPVNDWSMLTTSSASFVKMHASNLDISEGELLFGSLGTPATTFVQKLPTAESRTHRSMASVSNKTPRATTRRRL